MTFKNQGAGYEQKGGFKRRLTKEERRRLSTHCQENGHEAYE